MAGWLAGAPLVFASSQSGTATRGGPSTAADLATAGASPSEATTAADKAEDTKAPSSTPQSSPAPSEVSPVGLIAALEKAWGAADVDAVLACVSRETLELGLERCGGPPSGRFSRAQAEFLIRDLLHYGQTITFRVVAFEWKEEEGPRARAEWLHRMGSGETKADLDIALAQEAGVWCVVRIAAR